MTFREFRKILSGLKYEDFPEDIKHIFDEYELECYSVGKYDKQYDCIELGFKKSNVSCLFYQKSDTIYILPPLFNRSFPVCKSNDDFLEILKNTI